MGTSYRWIQIIYMYDAIHFMKTETAFLIPIHLPFLIFLIFGTSWNKLSFTTKNK